MPFPQRDPLALGAPYQLGNHRATYKPSIMGGIIAAILLFLFAVVWPVIYGQNRQSTSGFTWSFILSCTLPPILGLIIFGLISYFTVKTYRNPAECVFVYDNGFIYALRESLQCIYWQNVQAVRHNIVKRTSTNSQGHTTTATYHSYTVICTNGTQLRLGSNFVNIQQLGKSLEVGTARYLSPLALNTYRLGQTVVFGPLALTPQSFCYAGKTLPWTEMKSIKIDESSDYIVIKKQGKWFSWAKVSISEVPNIEVLRMLVQHILGAWPN